MPPSPQLHEHRNIEPEAVVISGATPAIPKLQSSLGREANKHLMHSFNEEALQNLSDRDRHIFCAFGQGPDVAPRFDLIHKGFEHYVLAQPEATAVEHLGETISYGALDKRVNQLANQLLKRGVKRGDTVGLYVQRSIPMIVGILAVLKVGAAYVPQHIGVAPPATLKHIAQVTAAKVILTLGEFEHLVPAIDGQQIIAIDKFILEDSRSYSTDLPAASQTKSDDRCFILFTSGTTGVPNGVQVTHRNVCNILQTAPGDMGIKPGTKVGQMLSVAFDMAAWEILGCLSNGGTLIIRGKAFQAVAEQVDVIISTPSILGTLDADHCHNVKAVAVAGEPCPRPLADKWSEFCSFYNSCGPTETTIINTAELHFAEKDKLSIGRPTPNNTVYILDEKMQPCPIGEAGEMWAGGDCVTAGYIGNDVLTADRYRADPFRGDGHVMFRTRDLGRWLDTGELEHLGRVDDQVKVRGFRVELDSVSSALESVEGCQQAVTLKLDDCNLVSFVRPASCKPEAFKPTMKERLHYYCVPQSIIPLDDFPRTARGKIDKRLLLEIAQDSQPDSCSEVV